MINPFLSFFSGKSHFYSSNWCLFGIETLGVLLVCVATAYSVGFICGVLINADVA